MTQISHLFTNFDRFDLLFKNFFEGDSFFCPAIEAKPKYPVDIYEENDQLIFEIAAVGLKKDDIQLEIKDGDTLHVYYENKNSETFIKEKSTYDDKYIHRGIAKRSFNFGWKISNKFDLNKIDANMENGLLTIKIPRAEEMKPKSIQIK